MSRAARSDLAKTSHQLQALYVVAELFLKSTLNVVRDP